MAEAPLPPEKDLYGKDDLHYLSFSAPVPTLPFIDIHDYDLPYGGKNFLHDTFAKSQTTPSPFQFKGSTVKKEGANLLSSLTGVKTDVTRHKHWVPGCGRVRCKYDQQFTEEAVKQLEDLLDGKKKRSSKSGSQRSRRSYVCYMVDECVDTGDLEGLVFDFDADSDTTVAQGSSSSSSDEDDSPEKKPGVMDKSPNEYLALIKDSMSRIGLRTQMLHDLSLGECPPREAPASAPARSQGQGSAAAAAQEADSPYMSHTSISVKQARKLVGAMHTDEQAIDLRDLLSWMEQLGAMAEEKSKEYESRQSLKPESTEQMKSRLQNVGGSDWRLPASPPIALQLANEDLQNRLANLYQEKNFLNNKIQSLRKEDLDESQNMPQEFMSALRSLVCFSFTSLRTYLEWKKTTNFLVTQCRKILNLLNVWKNDISYLSNS
ncbi:uncharacterized protein LOC112346049 [Selaginella moellendorffii]|uniref:uncharacterized protein LOC112346049 n=1 Tax=Selaginella moellendorffii TaxID=88036 RepID=UPI000D1C8A53|nr:uncharacterized protein LOC112346049 [Selaginella moellendorffii]|eukprot:XP_024529831.1 uncharacterized protein LOC112346049 [Selaginella moellendorffii]